MKSSSPAWAGAGSLAELRAEIARRGLDRPAAARILLECGLHAALLALGAALFFGSEGLAPEAAGVLAAALGSFGLATNAHTASHGALTASRRGNALLTYLGYPLLMGMSASYWRHKHVAVHHRAPNVVGVDDDIDLAPWFAIHDRTRAGAGPRLRAWYRVQWLALPFAIAFNGVNMLVTAWRFLLGRLADRSRRRASHAIDLAFLLGHQVLWLVLPALVFGAAPALCFYGLRAALMGYAMFVAFAPAHFPAEAMCVDREAPKPDPLLAVTATTVNFRTGWLGRLLCAGVEFQIEHHLFPRINHLRYREIAPLVEAHCRRYGYPYRTLGWDGALWESLRVFVVPKPVETSWKAARP